MKATLQYVQGTSFFHQLNPLTKLIWALLAGVLCFVCQNLYFLLAINVINIAIILNSKIGGRAKGDLQAVCSYQRPAAVLYRVF